LCGEFGLVVFRLLGLSLVCFVWGVLSLGFAVGLIVWACYMDFDCSFVADVVELVLFLGVRCFVGVVL